MYCDWRLNDWCWIFFIGNPNLFSRFSRFHGPEIVNPHYLTLNKETRKTYEVSFNSSIKYSVPLELMELETLFENRSLNLVRDEWPEEADRDGDKIGRGLPRL